MENLSTITCGTFLEKLASKAPTPGGGAASALCGAVAAALTAMLANLTVGKAGSEENEQQTAQIIAAAGKLREELTELADDDAAVFGKWIGAICLPQQNDHFDLQILGSRCLSVRYLGQKFKGFLLVF